MTARRPTRVIVLGPAAPVRGGIASVVDALQTSSLATQVQLAVLNTGKTTPDDRPWYIGVWSQARLAGTFVAMLGRHGGELVHIHTCSGPVFWRDSVLLVLGRLFGRKTIWHIHGGGFEQFVGEMRGVRRTLAAVAFAMSDAVIVLSEAWRARLSRHLKVRRWAVVENGVPLPPQVQRPSSADGLLFVGTLDGIKGADDVIAAAAIASRNGFRGSVSMAGRETSAGQREGLRRRIEREGLGGTVRLLGMVAGAEKVRAFETAGMFALPSYVEGLPMALLEAMAYGLPVIATKVGAIPEVVTDGVEGFLIAPGDVEALADRICRLWFDAPLRERMGAAARRRVEASYSIEAMAARVAEVYQSIRTVP